MSPLGIIRISSGFFLCAVMISSALTSSHAYSSTALKPGSLGSIYFSMGSAELTSSARITLSRFLPSAKAAAQISVVGYAPRTTSATKDTMLATARAQIVVSYLKNRGVTAKVTTKKVRLQVSDSVTRTARRAEVIISKLRPVPAPKKELFTYIIDGIRSASITGCLEICQRNLVIPATLGGKAVRSISDYAFDSQSLSSVTIPSSVTSIGAFAFESNSLTSLTIPSSVKNIGEGAFTYNSLTSVRIPASIKILSVNVFASNALASATIPNSVTIIGDGAFASNKLASIEIPDSVTSIGVFAFVDNLLESVTIPDSVTTISDGVFSLNALTSVKIPSSVTNIGESAFRENSLASVTLPESVISIGSQAFLFNKLTTLTVPQSVTHIGSSAFAANSLASVMFTGNAPADGGDVFIRNAGLATAQIYADAAGWGSSWSGLTVNPISR